MAPAAVARFDAEQAAMLAEEYPDDPMAALHGVWASTLRKLTT